MRWDAEGEAGGGAAHRGRARRLWRWEGGMGGGDVRLGESRWPNGSACLGGQWGADVSVVELVGQGLVEHELWDWFGLGVKRLSCA